MNSFKTLCENTITADQMRRFEAKIDEIFKKFKLDFEFTKHFGERMNDARNSPLITLKDLSDTMKKVYAKHGNPLKDKVGAESVIRDIQNDINIPVAVRYDAKNDEVDVVAKTVMRKKNFSTPDPVLRY